MPRPISSASLAISSPAETPRKQCHAHKLRRPKHGQIARRTFGGLLVIAVLFLVAPLAFSAQQQTGRVWQIGWLCSFSPGRGGLPHFVSALRARGYDSRNIRIEQRYADHNYARLRDLATELVRLKVDVIVTCDSRSIRPALGATSIIPIVMVGSADPVAEGYAASLARPGGNITGLSVMSPELAGKRLELARELAPSARRIAVLGHTKHIRDFEEIKLASKTLGIELVVLQVSAPSDFSGAFSLAEERKAGALIVLPSPITNVHARTIVEFAARAKLPAVYPARHYVAAGGLISYGPSIPEMIRRAADYVDKILKGAKPGDLPIQQPTTFEMVINSTTAKSLGLKIPHSLLVQAQSVIE